MLVTKNELITQINDIGLKSGEIVMLHASIRAIGKILGGPDQVHQAILEVIAPEGSLMMYVGCEPEYEAIGRREISAEEERVLLNNCPAFDYASARARRDYGILAEFFRSWPGVICSENPGARMAAFGKNSEFLMSNHPLNYGYGTQSPLEKLYKQNGKVLLLGSDLDQVTLLHFAEHIAPIKEKRIQKFKVPILKNDKRVWIDIEEYDTSDGIRQWPDRFFEKIVKEYLRDNNIIPKKIGNADSYLIDAKSFVDFAVPIFIEAAEKYNC